MGVSKESISKFLIGGKSKNLLIDSLLTPIVESTYLNRDMYKFESSQKDESRWQSTDSSKAYRYTSAFKKVPFRQFHICHYLRKNTSYNYHLPGLQLEKATFNFGLDCR